MARNFIIKEPLALEWQLFFSPLARILRTDNFFGVRFWTWKNPWENDAGGTKIRT